MAEQVSMELDVQSFGHLPRSNIAGPYDRSIFSFRGFSQWLHCILASIHEHTKTYWTTYFS